MVRSNLSLHSNGIAKQQKRPVVLLSIYAQTFPPLRPAAFHVLYTPVIICHILQQGETANLQNICKSAVSPCCIEQWIAVMLQYCSQRRQRCVACMTGGSTAQFAGSDLGGIPCQSCPSHQHERQFVRARLWGHTQGNIQECKLQVSGRKWHAHLSCVPVFFWKDCY